MPLSLWQREETPNGVQLHPLPELLTQLQLTDMKFFYLYAHLGLGQYGDEYNFEGAFDIGEGNKRYRVKLRMWMDRTTAYSFWSVEDVANPSQLIAWPASLKALRIVLPLVDTWISADFEGLPWPHTFEEIASSWKEAGEDLE